MKQVIENGVCPDCGEDNCLSRVGDSTSFTCNECKSTHQLQSCEYCGSTDISFAGNQDGQIRFRCNNCFSHMLDDQFSMPLKDKGTSKGGQCDLFFSLLQVLKQSSHPLKAIVQHDGESAPETLLKREPTYRRRLKYMSKQNVCDIRLTSPTTYTLSDSIKRILPYVQDKKRFLNLITAILYCKERLPSESIQYIIDLHKTLPTSANAMLEKVEVSYLHPGIKIELESIFDSDLEEIENTFVNLKMNDGSLYDNAHFVCFVTSGAEVNMLMDKDETLFLLNPKNIEDFSINKGFAVEPTFDKYTEIKKYSDKYSKQSSMLLNVTVMGSIKMRKSGLGYSLLEKPIEIEKSVDASNMKIISDIAMINEYDDLFLVEGYSATLCSFYLANIENVMLIAADENFMDAVSQRQKLLKKIVQ